LVPAAGLNPFEPRVNCPCAPTPPPLTLQPFLDFRAIFFLSTLARGTGTPYRDCAVSSNNRGPSWPKLSSIDVTTKAIFERLYLVPELSPFDPRVNCPCAPTTPPLSLRLFLDFCAIIFPDWPLHFFGRAGNLSKANQTVCSACMLGP